MPNKKQKKEKNMAEITKGYEDFIKGKEITDNSKDKFEKALKRAATPKPKKPRGSK